MQFSNTVIAGEGPDIIRFALLFMVEKMGGSFPFERLVICAQ